MKNNLFGFINDLTNEEKDQLAAGIVKQHFDRGSIIHRLEEQNPKVGLFLYKTATEKFSEVMWTMQQLLFMKIDTRIAIYLWDEIGRIGKDELETTHDMIAHQIGSSREVVTRVMKYFEKEGILSLGRGKVIVRDRDALKSLAYPNNVT